MDERLLAGVRRFWTREQVETAYRAVLQAYADAAVREVSIIGTTFDGQGATGTYVLDRNTMALWMDVLDARMVEYSTPEDCGPLIGGSPITDFSRRCVGT